MKTVFSLSLGFSAVSGALASTCSVKHDTAMSLDFYKNVKISQSDCCDLCGSDGRCRTAVYTPHGECHLHDAKDSARPFHTRGYMLMAVTPAPAPGPKGLNIVQLAQSVPDLSTLVTALTAGGLTATLSGTGPFTVFAPSNEAFAKIETKALSALLKNKVQLDKVLEYHVLAANLSMTELMSAKIVKTIEGENVKVSDSSGIKVNNANVVKSDVVASNGIVHIIDAVLMAPSLPPLPTNADIVQVAERTADLSTLVAALTAGKLVATLEGKGPFTVFAPTNEAFAKIPAADLQKLLKNTKELDAILEYHVLAGKFNMRDLMAVKSVKTLEGDEVAVAASGKDINVNDAKVLKADVAATNGIVHVIDTVLTIPKALIV